MTTKKCGECKKIKSDLEVWSYDEIGKLNWSKKDLSWMRINKQVCEDCLREYFKQYFDSFGKVKG